MSKSFKNLLSKKKPEPSGPTETQRPPSMHQDGPAMIKKKVFDGDSDEDSMELPTSSPPPKAPTSTSTTGGATGGEAPRQTTPAASSTTTPASATSTNNNMNGNAGKSGATTTPAMAASPSSPSSTTTTTTIMTTSTTTSSTSKTTASPNGSSSASSSPKNGGTTTALTGAPTKPRGRGEPRKKELVEMSRSLKDDPCAVIWSKFLADLCDRCDAIDEYEVNTSPEVFQDTFSNFDEVLEKCFDVLKAYVGAKADHKKYGEKLKDSCKELEAFSTFCSQRESSIKLLKSKTKAIKDQSKIPQLEELLARPIPAITEFSHALKKYSEEDYFPSNEFDEASAIMEDVVDNVLNVAQLYEGWTTSIPSPFRQLFLSPAKRSLLFVDSTVDQPAMLFNDFLMIFEVSTEKGQEVHKVTHQFPLALIEVEEKGKVTNLKAATLSLECQLKSPNNRAANTLRRKIIEAKEALGTQLACGLTLMKTLPADFPKINCTVTHEQLLILGTDKGLYTMDLAANAKLVRKVCNTEHRISKMSVSQALQLLIISQEEKDADSIDLFTYPLVALEAHLAVQKHIHPAPIDCKPKTKHFCCFDTERAGRKMLISSENVLQLFQQTRETHCIAKNTSVLEDSPTFMKTVGSDVYFGTKIQVMRFVEEPAGIQPIYHIKDGHVPIDCVPMNGWHVFGFAEHGIVYDVNNKETVSTLVWADTATSFAVVDQHLVIFTKNFIEVRHRKCLWQIKQIIPAPGLTVLNSTDCQVLINDQIFTFQQLVRQ